VQTSGGGSPNRKASDSGLRMNGTPYSGIPLTAGQVLYRGLAHEGAVGRFCATFKLMEI